MTRRKIKNLEENEGKNIFATAARKSFLSVLVVPVAL